MHCKHAETHERVSIVNILNSTTNSRHCHCDVTYQSVPRGWHHGHHHLGFLEPEVTTFGLGGGG